MATTKGRTARRLRDHGPFTTPKADVMRAPVQQEVATRMGTTTTMATGILS